jgi:DNA polymerase III delta subunit
MRPPIFWKEKESIKKQAITWKIDELKSRIYKINEIEFLIKSNSGKSLNLVSDFIVNF